MDRDPDVIFINGPSSAGKSSVIKELRPRLERPYFVLSSDQFVGAGMLPELEGGYAVNPAWQEIRPAFFDGFHRTIAAMATAGNPLIIEHVLEQRSWYDDCLQLFSGLDVFWVGLTATVDTIDAREVARGDRTNGEGRSHLEDGVHDFVNYDLFVDTSALSPHEVAGLITDALRGTS